MCEKTQILYKLQFFFFPFFLREADVSNMGRLFLLLHNLEVE
jgi:hypothetical protein